ncbi:MAG: hypothetical protein ACO1SX_25965 [Actinomycetota bacterium]
MKSRPSLSLLAGGDGPPGKAATTSRPETAGGGYLSGFVQILGE